MADISLTNGWHSTDDDVPVPVRVSTTPARAPAQDLQQLVIDSTHEAPVVIVSEVTVKPTMMRLSAVLGIALVIGTVVAYFGIGGEFLKDVVGNLAGDLTGSQNATITITTAGYFSPDAVTLYPGDTVTLLNVNPDPQVIKSKNGRDLFDVQVLFTDPFTFTVPDSAMGPYVYFSETLPEDRTVTITVVPPNPQTDPVPVSNPLQESTEIPLPFGDGMAAQPLATSPSLAVRPEKTEHSGETAAIRVGGQEQTQEPAGSKALPTNPYTVGSPLHSGAPLDNFKCDTKSGKGCKETTKGTKGGVVTPPKRITETGPAGMLVLLVPALGAMAYVYRRTVRA